MKLVIKRVISAKVTVNQNVISSINNGLLIFVGISRDFNDKKLDYLANKVFNLRVWPSKEKGFDLSVKDIKGEILIVSQFTLHGVVDGNKPNFRNSADYDFAKEKYEEFVHKVRNLSGLKVRTGEFGAMMKVDIENDGPVTIILEK